MSHHNSEMHVGISAVLFACGLLMIPLTAGVVLLTQVSRSDVQINAAPVVNKCDLNRDNVVDENDVNLAADGFGRVMEGSSNAKFDFDRDGWVNTADLNAISNNAEICKQ